MGVRSRLTGASAGQSILRGRGGGPRGLATLTALKVGGLPALPLSGYLFHTGASGHAARSWWGQPALCTQPVCVPLCSGTSCHLLCTLGKTRNDRLPSGSFCCIGQNVFLVS